MTETKEYPLPTVHLNGTGKEMLLEGNYGILRGIDGLEESISKCEFHGRDYYVQDGDYAMHEGDAYQEALKERQKHFRNINAFREYIEEHIKHIDGQ